MLMIKRLKVRIKTPKGEYGFDEIFKPGLNFVASDNNTRGKSSVLIAIYYCLGFEEIIGGVNEKVLTSVYKSVIEDDADTWPVLESGAFLEIYNGYESITIFRAAKMKNRDSRLVTVYFGDLEQIKNEDIGMEEFYVHMKNSATNTKGFHSFLEKFLNVKLPIVTTSDDSERKLYLQLIFSSMFIEQKHGWSDIFSGMPYLGIKDAKKRVTEFVLGLDTFENERKRNQLVSKERNIKDKWKMQWQELIILQGKEECKVIGIPILPEILDEDFNDKVNVFELHGSHDPIDIWIERLKGEYESLKTIRPKVVDNFEELQNELYETEEVIVEKESALNVLQDEYNNHIRSIVSLKQNIEVIKNDISNNKDAEKLQKLGSQLGCQSSNGKCPVCHQDIQDTLLPGQHQYETMSIEQNIRHLNAQKKMLEYALKSHESIKEEIDIQIQKIKANIITLQRLAKSIRNDLYSVNEDLSETVIFRRMSIARKIEDLQKFSIELKTILNKFMEISRDWKKYLEDKESMPKEKFSLSDLAKIQLLQDKFKYNLKEYRYTSTSNVDNIEISKENYLPTIEDFDMKFDSSASDNIRAIWAYTMALLQTSLAKQGNHFGSLIFDEPAQHSIGSEDMEKFFKSILSYGDACQVIIGITVNTDEIKDAIEKLEKDKYHLIKIGSKAFLAQ
ncbi:hypothetical protein JMF89_04100 [Clostridiaceae bacterium UIB06]|uniref:Rad50/SbcC-type AAA domain-containing protein n=1 Tax=Clostridium thailandense TaxID=2794346 RepID=A0A949TWF2_9CLOT|nr:hypothetical protein [Clostridium thailandense]MBV7271634.1 hypothetical protein [Clostridium thailandense]MCH5136396.1 hypothetical protein [Clostridiaceae bacterium UIB06]